MWLHWLHYLLESQSCLVAKASTKVHLLLTSKPSALCIYNVQTQGTRNQNSCSVFTQLDFLAQCENYHMFHCQEKEVVEAELGVLFGLTSFL